MAIYHLNVKTGSKAKGQSAAAKADYIEREGKYKSGKEELLHIESGNMPAWAKDDSALYWRMADENERANARLFTQVEFALPIELSEAEQIALSHDFAKQLTEEQNLPFTLAIHKGKFDHKGRESATPENPHCHLIISERINDNIERPAEQWFRRANKKNPSKGGAVKSEILKRRDWLCQTREQWQDFANEALKKHGIDARIDHRTLEAQGIDRIPQIHKGASEQMNERGIATERHSRSVAIDSSNLVLGAMSHEAAKQDAIAERLKKAIERVKKIIATTPSPHIVHGRSFNEANGLNSIKSMGELPSLGVIRHEKGRVEHDMQELPTRGGDLGESRERARLSSRERVLHDDARSNLESRGTAQHRRVQQAREEPSELEKAVQAVQREFENLDKDQLTIRYEKYLQEQRETAADIRQLPYRQEEIQKRLDEAKEQATESYNRHAEFSGKTLAKMRYGKEIKQAAADNARAVKVMNEAQAELERLPDIDKLEHDNKILEAALKLAGAELRKKSAAERIKQAGELSPDLQERWRAVEKAVADKLPRHSDNEIQHQRLINSKFSDFLRLNGREPTKRDKNQNRGYER